MGYIAKQNIDGHTKALNYVMETMNIGKANKDSLLKYFKYQRIDGMGDDTPNKLIVGNKFDTSILKWLSDLNS